MRRCVGVLAAAGLIVTTLPEVQASTKAERPPPLVLNACKARAMEAYEAASASSTPQNPQLGYGISYIMCANSAGYEYSYITDPMPVLSRPHGKWTEGEDAPSSVKAPAKPLAPPPAKSAVASPPKPASVDPPANRAPPRPAARREATDDRCAVFKVCASDTPRAANMSITTSPSIFAKCGAPPTGCQ